MSLILKTTSIHPSLNIKCYELHIRLKHLFRVEDKSETFFLQYWYQKFLILSESIGEFWIDKINLNWAVVMMMPVNYSENEKYVALGYPKT